MLDVKVECPSKEEEGLDNVRDQVETMYGRLMDGDVPGSDMLGWIDLPTRMQGDISARITRMANEIRERGDRLITAGIGGSYLGSRAVIEALQPNQGLVPAELTVQFAGHHLSGPYHQALLSSLDQGSVYANVISKSGTTTETALAFRLLFNRLKQQYSSEELERRIIVTTSPDSGALLEASKTHGFRRFAIPEGVGGRYSVLSPVGLLPIAAAGIDVGQMLEGASEMMETLTGGVAHARDAIRYAALRNHLYQRGFALELFVSFYPELSYIGKWWQQLFGESEGKTGKALYPATVDNTTDLHSLGQYIQQGPRHLFETMIRIDRRPDRPVVPEDREAEDGLDYLAGMSLENINREALEGTREAHLDGGVPVLILDLPVLNEQTLGGLLYFFQFSCALSALQLGVNPFDQPGVEAYKNNMYRRLGKPGY